MRIRIGFKINLTSEAVAEALTNINGVPPERWFVAKARGRIKNKILGYIVNDMQESIQLIPIVGDKKNCSIQIDGIHNIAKSDAKIIVVKDAYNTDIKIKTETEKYRLISCLDSFETVQKENVKQFRNTYGKSKESKIALAKLILQYILIFSMALLLLYAFDELSSRVIIHYQYAKDLKNFVEQEEIDSQLQIPLLPYDKTNIKFDSGYYTDTCGNIRLSLPENCKALEEKEGDMMRVYTTGTESDSSIMVAVDKEPHDYSEDYDEYFEEDIVIEKLNDICQKEFGVPIEGHYNLMKATMSICNPKETINYFSRKEMVLYRVLLMMRLVGTVKYDTAYDYSTPSFNSLITVSNFSRDGDNRYIVSLSLYPKDNPNLNYQVVIVCKNADINEAYKIINSVELV
ncbi:MAG: hypothetical protein ACI4SX_08270 [Candidatus Fimenecus sp.]